MGWSSVPRDVQQGQRHLQLHPASSPEHSGEPTSVLLPANHGRSLPPQADSGWSLGLDRWEDCLRSWLQHWRSREENERSFWIFWSSCHAWCNNPHCHTTYLII